MAKSAKKIYRSRTDRKIAGICGGIAEYFGIDSTIVRVIAVILLLPGGAPGILIYIILCIFIPEHPDMLRKNTPPRS